MLQVYILKIKQRVEEIERIEIGAAQDSDNEEQENIDENEHAEV